MILNIYYNILDSCEEDQFLCKRNQMCLSPNYECDGTQQCPLGEDEANCCK